MIVFYGSFTGKNPIAIIVTLIMAVTCAVLGLYFGACMASTSTNSEYLIRKLFLGALAGFLTCILLMVYAMSAFKFDDKNLVFAGTIIIYLLAVTYLGFVLVLVVLPGHAENKDDVIWGVLQLYLYIGMVILLIIIIFAKITGKGQGTGNAQGTRRDEERKRPRR